MRKFTRYGFSVLATAMFLLTLNAQTTIESKLVGIWKLNTAKSQFQGVPRPIQAVFKVSKATASHFKWQVETQFMSGGQTAWQTMAFDGAIDGQPYEYKGAERGSRISFVENNGMLQGTATYTNGGTVHQNITVSPDGNTMTSECSLSFPNSTASWSEVWERVPDKRRK